MAGPVLNWGNVLVLFSDMVVLLTHLLPARSQYEAHGQACSLGAPATQDWRSGLVHRCTAKFAELEVSCPDVLVSCLSVMAGSACTAYLIFALNAANHGNLVVHTAASHGGFGLVCQPPQLRSCIQLQHTMVCYTLNW
jgi:hypothetical protein